MEQLLAPKPLADGLDLPDEWKNFKRDFELFLVATSKDEADTKVKSALLLRTIGRRGNQIYESFTWTQAADKNTYDVIITKFDDYCKPRVNVIAKTHSLLTCRQGNKTVDEFITELHTIASLCDFKTMYDRMVLHALVLGIEKDRTRKKLFEQPDIDLAKAIELCRQEETTAKDYQTMTGQVREEQAHAIRHKPPYNANSDRGARAARPREPDTRTPPGFTQTNPKSSCGNCGTSHPPRSCPAYGRQCNNCSKFNHYAALCRSKRKPNRTETANQVSWNYSSDSDVEQVNCITTEVRNRKLLAKVTVQANDKTVDLEFQLDTAATCNTLNTRDYHLLGQPKLAPAKTTLTLYDQSRCVPKGWVYLPLQEKDGKYTTRSFLVIDTAQHSLLSWNTCQEMKLLQLNEQVHAMSTGDEHIEALLTDFADIFTGLGRLQGDYQIELEEGCRPVQVRPRKVPLTMKGDLIDEIKTLEERGIIAKVDEPTDWISHIQPVRKPNGKIRVCIDPQNLNKVIRRNHTVMPTLDDVLPQLNNAKFFSVCDAKEGFYQIPLAEDSTNLTTFWTPIGKYKYLRMPFGIASAPEEFQRRLTEGLVGLSGVTVVADDLLIYGATRRQHDDNLRALFLRAREIGLRLNRDKCKFIQDELPYIGHLLTSEGVKPDPNKVRSILDMEPPQTQQGVKRFLGHVTYMSKFVNNLSAESEPLRRLLKQENHFEWSDDQINSFNRLKNILTNAETLQYFDPTQPVVIQTDASTAGIGAALLQHGKPVAYASRSLTKCEQSYVPLELECLAIVFGADRFDQYIFGHRDATIHTDHEPLVSIFKKSIHKVSRRLQAMLLHLQRYPNIKVTWRKGTEQLTADLLSRDSYFEQPDYQQPPEHLFAVTEGNPDPPLPDSLMEEVRSATEQDQELGTLSHLISNRWTDVGSPVYKMYRHFREELTIDGGILYKGARVIIPKTMQTKILKLLHVSHNGINSTLRRARHTVFWIGMNTDITRQIQSCRECQIDAPKQPKETMQSHEVPRSPWTKVGVDLFEQQSTHYMVIVDYNTDYFEYEHLANQSTLTVINALKKCFGRLGIPKTVMSDNGPQFTAHQFDAFSRDWNFSHITSSPHFPQSNGKAEAAVKIAKRILRRCSDPELALLEHRNTPVENADTSPIQQLLGRPTRSVLPQNTTTLTQQGLWERKQYNKRKAQQRYNRAARDLPPLRQGQPVLVRDWQSHRRQWKDSVVEKQLSDRSYAVLVDDNLMRRNRRDIRPHPDSPQHPALNNLRPSLTQDVEQPTPDDVNIETVPDGGLHRTGAESAGSPRRSTRDRRPPAWLNDYVA